MCRLAFVTATVCAGQVFIPMHYGLANKLTRAEFDPHSRQPSYKHCAVRIEVVKMRKTTEQTAGYSSSRIVLGTRLPV